MTSSRGFTLIEILVVIAIIGFLGGALVVNFRSSATSDTARRQAAHVVSSDLRNLQSQALAGTKYQNMRVCGYGMSYNDATSYILFVRPAIPGISCADDVRQKIYRPLQGDRLLEQKSLINSNMVFKLPFSDIFFELPYSTTYLNGSSLPSQPPVSIEIVSIQNPTSSATISVFASGKVDIK